jgi:hypothetical protein
MAGLISFFLLCALMAALFMAAISYMAFQAGALSARKAAAQGNGTLGQALASYVVAMVVLLSAIVGLAWVLERAL